jgi:transcriptional regulator with XRE-family HTH domain
MIGGHEQPPAASPTLARRQLGHELRRIREQTGKTGDRVARELSWSPSKISRAELAKIIPTPGEVGKLLSYYQVTGPQHDCLLQLAHTAHQTSWWHNYTADLPAHQLELIGLEDAAADILIWAADMVPALLQTQAYARHVTDSYRHIEPIAPQQASRQTAVTLRRQHLLTRHNPPLVSVVLAEAALRRPADHPQVMPQQLHHLAALADGHPALTVHVLPLTCPQPVFTGSFTVLGFGPAEDGLPDVVALDHLTSGCLIDDEREAYLYRLTHQHLAAGALDPAQSRSLLLQMASVSSASPVPVAGPMERWPRAADG